MGIYEKTTQIYALSFSRGSFWGVCLRGFRFYGGNLPGEFGKKSSFPQAKKLTKKHLGVSKNRCTPKSSILIRFSIIFTIHFGGFPPILGSTPTSLLSSTFCHQLCPGDPVLQLMWRLPLRW